MEETNSFPKFVTGYRYLGKKIPFSKGIATLELSDLKAFDAFLSENLYFKGFIWPGIFRNQSTPLSQGIIEEHLKKFKVFVRGRFPNLNDYHHDDNEIWAIGQHYGLKTPLLDWSVSPYVALFFAFEGQNKRENESPVLSDLAGRPILRSVYFLNSLIINFDFYNEFFVRLASKKYDRLLAKLQSEDFDLEEIILEYESILDKRSIVSEEEFIKISEAKKIVENSRLSIFSPRCGENSRIINQRGLFTKLMANESVEDYVRRIFPEKEVLLKVNIRSLERSEILKKLDSMNINYMSLYPDIAGAALYTNTKLKH
jgi:hypothetical protein